LVGFAQETANLKLEDFLIMPVQRIPRYEMLLSKILSLTAIAHPDYPYVQQALSLVRSIAVEGTLSLLPHLRTMRLFDCYHIWSKLGHSFNHEIICCSQ